MQRGTDWLEISHIYETSQIDYVLLWGIVLRKSAGFFLETVIYLNIEN